MHQPRVSAAEEKALIFPVGTSEWFKKRLSPAESLGLIPAVLPTCSLLWASGVMELRRTLLEDSLFMVGIFVLPLYLGFLAGGLWVANT